MPLFTRVRSWYQKAAAPCSFNQVAARLRGLWLPSSPFIAKALRRCLQGGFRSVECSLRVPAEVSISNSELCALVSNMLDNALNACEDVDPGKRFVIFKASVKGSYLVLDMRNSKPTSEGDEGRETTRRGILDRIRFAEEQTSGGSLAEHGWGLSVIDTIVQRYDGAVSLEHFKTVFRMSVMVDLAAQT